MQRNAVQCDGKNNTTLAASELLMMAVRQCSTQMCWSYLKFKIKPNLNFFYYIAFA